MRLLNLLGGAILLGALPAFTEQPQIQQHSSTDAQKTGSTVESRQLVVPKVAPPILIDPFHKSTHSYPPLDNDEEYAVYGRGPGRVIGASTEWNRNERIESLRVISPSLAKRQVGGDFEAKKNMFESGSGANKGPSSGGSGKPAANLLAPGKVSGLEGQFENNNGAPSAGGSGKPADGAPAPGKVSGLKGQFENVGGSSAGGSGKPAAAVPPQGKVGNLKGQFENDVASTSNTGKPAVADPGQGTVNNLKGQFEGDSARNFKPTVHEPNTGAPRPGSDARPRPKELPKPGTVQDLKDKFENPTVSEHESRPIDPVREGIVEDRIDQLENPAISDAGRNSVDLDNPVTVQELKDQFENPTTSDMNHNSVVTSNSGTVQDLKNQFENPVTGDPRPKSVDASKPGTVQDLKNQFENPVTGDSIPSSVDSSSPGTVQELKDKFEKSGTAHTAPKPVDVDKTGTVQDLKNQFENPVTDTSSSKPIDLKNQGTVQDLKGQFDAPADGFPFAAPAPKPGQPSDPVPKEPSIADQLREFSAVDINGKPIDPQPVTDTSAPKPGLHNKINTWEKPYSNKDAKKRPEATYPLDDPALSPRPPIEPIPKDAGLIDDFSKQMEAIRKSNPEIKKFDNEINDLIKDMKKNAQVIKNADAELDKIKWTQKLRDAQENEMLARKRVLEEMRKRLANESAKLGKDNSHRQEDLAIEAKNLLEDAYRSFGKSLEKMQSTLAKLKEWKKTKEIDLAEGKQLKKSMDDDQARRQEASRALQKENAKMRGWKKPPQVPPIVRATQVDGGRISSIDTQVPPPNMPLPAPLPGSVFPADHPMRVALDDIRIKGKLTQETADALVASGWGISPAAERFLKDNKLPYDNMVIAKGAISGFASIPHLAPASVLAASPEILELAALAGSPEIMSAIGAGMAAPVIANAAAAALPAIGGGVSGVAGGIAGVAGIAGSPGVLNEEKVKQAVTAAQIVSIRGKDALRISRLPLALVSAGTGVGLGFVGGLLTGMFAKKRAKDGVKNDVKDAVYTVGTTITKVDSKTTMERVTEIIGGKTVTVEKTLTPQSTPSAFSKVISDESVMSSRIVTKSSSALKTTSSSSIKASQSMTKSSSSHALMTTSLSSPKSTETLKTSSLSSSTATAIPKQTGSNTIVLPPVVVPPPPSSATINVTTSIDDSSKQPVIPPPPGSALNVTEPVRQGENRIAPVLMTPGLDLNVTESVEQRNNSTWPVVIPSDLQLNITVPAEQGAVDISSMGSPLDLSISGTSSEALLPTPNLNITDSAGNGVDHNPMIFVSDSGLDPTEPSEQGKMDTLPIFQPPCPSTDVTTWMELCRNSPVAVPLTEIELNWSKTDRPAVKKTHTITSQYTNSTEAMRKATNGRYPVLPDFVTKSRRTTTTATTSKIGATPTAVALTTFETSLKPTATLLWIQADVTALPTRAASLASVLASALANISAVP